MNRKKFILSGALAAGAASLLPIQSLGKMKNPMISASVIESLKKRIKPISQQEYMERRKRAVQLMVENNLDVFFCESGTSMRYFTGISWGRSERLFAMMLFQNGELHFIAPKFEEARAMEQVGNQKLATWQENESPFKLIQKIITEKGNSIKTLAFEETTRFFVSDNLQKEMPSMTFTNAMPVSAGCRSIKSSHEIELMQIANEMAAEVFKSSIKELKTGITEHEFSEIISSGFAEFGVDGGALVLFGEASALPHGHLKQNQLKIGDIVLIDGGCTVEGYESDITRTTVFGKPTQRMRDVWQVVRNAQDAALSAAKPGVTGESVDAAARKVIEQAGFGNGYTAFTHRLGHGIGMDGHEWYYLVGGNTRLLQTGNMFSNEPGIYLPGEFGIRLEDEMLITETGSKLLLPQAKGLEQIF